MKFLPALFFVATMAAAQPYQVPQVPHKMNFAGITLSLQDDARREIQKDVDALWQSPKHFNIKVERAKTYFPIIEKIFAEEHVPDDFKYLVLQESALIADAVSVSNAVGFWQFKDFTALEMGLRVDDTIDERMNIVSATRGAARYIKKNNYQFNNWIYALQAYQMGAGGVARSVKDVESGARHMNVTSSTYWYVKKFLAHKVAFEHTIKGTPQQPVTAYENNLQKTADEVAAELAISTTDVLAFNKWIRKGLIPNDKTYTVLVPLPENQVRKPVASVANTKHAATAQAKKANEKIINGVVAIQAQAGETMTTLAARAGISLPAFLNYNDLQGFEKIIPDQYYFTAVKKSKGENLFATAGSNDNLWLISQRHGVRLKKLKKYNRTVDIATQPGEQIWLASAKPRGNTEKTTFANTQTDDRFFSWSAQPQDSLSWVVTKHESEEARPAAFSTQTDVIVEKEATTRPVISEPKTESLQTEFIHQVTISDTLYGISRQYNVTIKEIMEWNGKKDFTITVGERLRLFKK
jgi:membrane-bound lytic murein transglycosylase D